MKRRGFVRSLCAAAAIPTAGCSLAGQGKHVPYRPSGTMPQRTFGKTGMRVSLLGFGSHLAPELVADPVLRDRMIRLGYEGGINLFDVYDHMEYRQFKPMGESLKDFRPAVHVSLCIVGSTQTMQAEIDGALRDFHTDYIDLHRLYTVDDDRMAIMEKNRRAGKIRAIGVVAHDVKELDAHVARYGGELDFTMLIYNFHHNRALLPGAFPPNDYGGFLPRCQALGLGVLGIKPMGSDGMVALAKKRGFFRKRDVSVAQAMLRYAYREESLHTVMPAMNSLDEVAQNLESAYAPHLSGPEEALLRELSAVASGTGSAYLAPDYQWLERWA